MVTTEIRGTMYENRKFLKSTRTGKRKSINVFAKSTVMHISNDCFGLQKNHSQREWRDQKVYHWTVFSLRSRTSYRLQLKHFPHLICLILGIQSKLANNNWKWLDHLVERRTAVWEADSSRPEPDQHSWSRFWNYWRECDTFALISASDLTF